MTTAIALLFWSALVLAGIVGGALLYLIVSGKFTEQRARLNKSFDNWWEKRKARKSKKTLPALVEDEPEDDRDQKLIWLSGTLVTYFLLFHSTIFACAVVLDIADFTGNRLSLSMVSLALFTAHLYSSLQTCSEIERGGLILFGRVLYEFDSGLVFTPFPARMYLIAKTQIKVDFGTMDDKSEDAKELKKKMLLESENNPTWFVMDRPIRINWGDINEMGSSFDKKPFENDPLARRMTTDPHFYLIFRVVNLRDLISHVGSLEEAMERIQDVCITTMQDYAGKTFIGMANKDIDNLSLKLREQVEYLIGDRKGLGHEWALQKNKPEMPSWGIDLLDIRVKDLGISHKTNSAMVERSESIAKADGEALATARRSEGEATRIQNEGDARAKTKHADAKANADYIQQELNARANGLERLAAAASKPGGELVTKTEAVKAGLEHGKVVFANGDAIGGMVNAVMAGKIALDSVSQAGSKTPPTAPPNP